MTTVQTRDVTSEQRIPPGPTGLPLLGAVNAFWHNSLDFSLENYRRYGDVVRIDVLGLKGAILHGAAANRYILVDAVDNFLVAPLIDRVRARWIVGEGLLFIDDPKHKRERRLIMPAFHRKRIDDYQRVMSAATDQMLAGWRPGVTIDIAHEMHRLALIIAGRTLFNMDLANSANELGPAVATVVEAVSDPLNIALAQLPVDVFGIGKGRTLRHGLARIDAILRKIIERHEREHDDTGDVVSMLVAARDEEGGHLSTEQVRDQLLTLFVAGHETSANALAWAFYLLAQHPQVTARLLDEIDHELGTTSPQAADLERLPYLEQVVKEVLRLYPPAPSANRVAKEAFEWHGYTVRAGDLVVYSPFISHRMPENFREPELFRPERFDPVNGDPIPNYAYIPFAAGPRSCIGAPFATMEIKTVITMVLQRFRLDLIPGQYIEATVRTTTQPKDTILMRPYVQDGQVERSPAPVTGNVVGAVRR
ncbi:MAG: cytochrome P450 [Chloroflexota bacterium]